MEASNLNVQPNDKQVERSNTLSTIISNIKSEFDHFNDNKTEQETVKPDFTAFPRETSGCEVSVNSIIVPQNEAIVSELISEPEAMVTTNIDEPVTSIIANEFEENIVGNELQNTIKDSTNESLYFIDKREINHDIEIDHSMEDTRQRSERRSSSSSSSDSESDSISLPDDVLSDDSDDSCNAKGKRNASTSILKVKPVYAGVKTRGELDLQDLPPIEDLHITVPENDIHHIGKVSSVVSCLVVIQSFENEKPLDLDSVLFTKNGTSLGKVFDVFGRVVAPFYTVRFNNESDIVAQGVNVGDDVFSAPSHQDVTNYVFAEKLLRQKGSDASWMDNNEPPDECLEFSDDEQERHHRQKLRAKRKGNTDVSIVKEIVTIDQDTPQHSGRQTKTPRMPRPVIHPPRFQNTNGQNFQPMSPSGFNPNQNQFPPPRLVWPPNSNFRSPHPPNNFGPYNPFGFYNAQQPFPQPQFGQIPWGRPGYMLPDCRPGFQQSPIYGPQCFTPGGSFNMQQNFRLQSPRFSLNSTQSSSWIQNFSPIPPPPPPPSNLL